MNSKKRLLYIGLGVIIDFVIVLTVILTSGKSTNLENNVNNITAANMSSKQAIPNTEEKIIQSEPKEEIIENNVEEEKEENIVEEVASTNVIDQVEEVQSEEPIVAEEVLVPDNSISTEDAIAVYDNMSIEEKENALFEGSLHLEYSGLYTYSNERLTVSKGALYFNNHKETYYSEKVLPGTGLNIPGRHVAEDGTIRDGDGYICVAANQDYMAKGSILITSLGPAKVYDTGCAYGTIDIYVSW